MLCTKQAKFGSSADTAVMRALDSLEGAKANALAENRKTAEASCKDEVARNRATLKGRLFPLRFFMRTEDAYVEVKQETDTVNRVCKVWYDCGDVPMLFVLV